MNETFFKIHVLKLKNKILCIYHSRAQSIGHEPTAHENNRTPYRLGTSPVEIIGYQRTVQCVDCA